MRPNPFLKKSNGNSILQSSSLNVQQAKPFNQLNNALPFQYRYPDKKKKLAEIEKFESEIEKLSKGITEAEVKKADDQAGLLGEIVSKFETELSAANDKLDMQIDPKVMLVPLRKENLVRRLQAHRAKKQKEKSDKIIDTAISNLKRDLKQALELDNESSAQAVVPRFINKRSASRGESKGVASAKSPVPDE